MYMSSKNIWCFIAIALITTACYKTIEVDLPVQDPVLIYDQYNSGVVQSKLSFRLGKGVRITDYVGPHHGPDGYMVEGDAFDSVVGAQVLIYKDGSLFEQISGNGTATYIGSKDFVEGSAYDLKLTLPGEETRTASFRMPYGVQPQITVEDDPENENYQYLRITLIDQEPGVRNFYRISSGTLSSYLAGFPPQPETFETYGSFTSDSPLLTDINRMDNFDPLGESEENKYFNYFAYLSDELFDGSQTTFRIKVADLPVADQPDESYKYVVVLETLPVEQYLFLKTYANQQFNRGDAFAQPVEIYSNMEKTLGAFAVQAFRKTVVN